MNEEKIDGCFHYPEGLADLIDARFSAFLREMETLALSLTKVKPGDFLEIAGVWKKVLHVEARAYVDSDIHDSPFPLVCIYAVFMNLDNVDLHLRNNDEPVITGWKKGECNE